MLKIKNVNKKISFALITTLIVATLVGPMVYLGFASLFHFIVMGIFLYTLLTRKLTLQTYKNPIMIFLEIWLLVAILSNIWSVSKSTSLQYTYYIFLIYAMGYIFTNHFSKDMLPAIINLFVFMVIILNIIAIWETFTGNHLNSSYLSNANRQRLFRYLPATFFNNPNDFATYIIQIIPFNLAGINSNNKFIKNIALANIPLSVFSIFAAQARTQMFVLFITYAIYALFGLKKKELLKVILGILIVSIFLLKLYPNATVFFRDGLNSISGQEVKSSVEDGSMEIRIALLKNAALILLDSFGIGVGAGCHRIVMPFYSEKYFYTHNILVMHNFVGELFADYGLVVGILFIAAIANAFRLLLKIRSRTANGNERIFLTMLASTLLTFVVSGISSSSIIQLTSIWITFCMISAILNVYSKKNDEVF